MAKVFGKIKVDLEDIEAILEEIKALQTYKLFADDDMILVDRAKVGEVLARHVKARFGDD